MNYFFQGHHRHRNWSRGPHCFNVSQVLSKNRVNKLYLAKTPTRILTYSIYLNTIKHALFIITMLSFLEIAHRYTNNTAIVLLK